MGSPAGSGNRHENSSEEELENFQEKTIFEFWQTGLHWSLSAERNERAKWRVFCTFLSSSLFARAHLGTLITETSQAIQFSSESHPYEEETNSDGAKQKVPETTR